MRLLRKRKQRTMALAFSPDGANLAVAGRVGMSGRMDVWNLATSAPKPLALSGLSRMPFGAAFTPTGALAVARTGGITLYHGPQFRESRAVREWPHEEYTLTAFSPDGRFVLIDTAPRLELVALEPPFPLEWSGPATGRRVTPGMGAFSPDGTKLAVKGERSVEVRDAATGHVLTEFEPPSGLWMGFKLLWSPCGRWVAELWQQWVAVWDAGTGRVVWRRSAEFGEWINAAAFHRSGRLAVGIAGRKDGVVRVFTPGDWREAVALAWPVGRVEALDFSPDGTLAACGGDLPDVVLWDVDW